MKDEIHLEIGRKDIDFRLTTLTSAFEKGLEESKLFTPYEIESNYSKKQKRKKKRRKTIKKE